MTGPDFDEEPAEHRRFARYLHDLEAVDESDEADLVAVVLGDQDTTMAESAVGRHMDRRAAQLLATAAFTLWTDTMADVIADHDFLTRRLHEWRLLRTIVMGDPWAVDEVTGASDWFQRTATTTQIVSSPEALRLLRDHGRTRRIRNAASHRLDQLEQRT
ncbi:hypothetical protein [Actinomadura verrucosospora]|uniref:Uncharacterized protein n=1 Tax=Actinomadura verrucosospora TaxID=46165 RepID=A0A7D3ZDE1_ACTVE|nr:hypothetical protein [Actinomadura verrucosospora]QKG20077.1 hypothetical protein ACTIVE_1713 [Actinomadura verrucosospora]